MPVGVRVALDAQQRTLSLLEPAVRPHGVSFSVSYWRGGVRTPVAVGQAVAVTLGGAGSLDDEHAVVRTRLAVRQRRLVGRALVPGPGVRNAGEAMDQHPVERRALQGFDRPLSDDRYHLVACPGRTSVESQLGRVGHTLAEHDDVGAL